MEDLTFDEDAELLKEAGFELEKIQDTGSHIKVNVEWPVERREVQSFKFSKESDWFETKKYVKNGEILEDPRWIIYIRDRINQKLKASGIDGLESYSKGDELGL